MAHRNRPFIRFYKYYEILKVSRTATQAEIKQAFRKLANQFREVFTSINPDPKRVDKFKKINEAYEVLSDPAHRKEYDNSLAECPVCWTHEVIQTTEAHWRCQHCGCKFNPSQASEIIEQVEKAAIPERLRNILRVFQTSQCSWCRRFYTQPFLCPYRRLQSGCISFDRLDSEERGHLLGDEKWWWRMADMIHQVEEIDIMARCRDCGALNPNPQKITCWQCGRHTLSCPRCRESPILRYYLKDDYWKCPSAGCSKKFAIRPKKKFVEPTLSQELCPDCGKNLYYDGELLLWRCRNCRRIYTKQDLETQHAYQKTDRMETGQASHRTKDAHKPVKLSIDPPLWLVNILESKRFWKILICSAVVWWCFMAVKYSGNSVGLALGLAMPILLLYAIKVVFRKFLTGYNGLASKHQLSQFFYSIRKSSLLRFVIILGTIGLLVTTIWSIISLIHNLIESGPRIYLLNLLVLIIAQIWLLSWLCGMLKHSRQLSSKPKFAVVFWSLLAVAVFCALVGIPPFSNVITSVANWWDKTTTVTETSVETTSEVPADNLPYSSDTPNYSSTTYYEINKSQYPNRVWTNDYTYVSSTDGRAIELYENPNAKKPTWNQLLSFLRTDNTDKITYVPGDFVCIDFAEMLHNNAEKSGIRCGLVILWGINHACNAFETIDKGLVFIDCTGLTKYEAGPANGDTIVDVRVGTTYVPRYLFSDQLGNVIYTPLSMGTVTRYQICWVAGEIMDYQYDYATASASYIPHYVPPPSYSPYYPPYYPPSSSYIPPSSSAPTPPTSVPVCRSCCEDRCSKYQGTWRNGCIDDCMKGGTDKWTWE